MKELHFVTKYNENAGQRECGGREERKKESVAQRLDKYATLSAYKKKNKMLVQPLTVLHFHKVRDWPQSNGVYQRHFVGQSYDFVRHAPHEVTARRLLALAVDSPHEALPLKRKRMHPPNVAFLLIVPEFGRIAFAAPQAWTHSDWQKHSFNHSLPVICVSLPVGACASILSHRISDKEM